MTSLLSLSDEELARLLQGEASNDSRAFHEIASFIRELRERREAGVAFAVRESHLESISRATSTTSDRADARATPPKRRGTLVRIRVLTVRAASVALAASFSMIGLAYAGVDLPGNVFERTIEAVTTLDLPNQDSDRGSGKSSDQGGEASGKSVSDTVHAAQNLGLKGCERGQAISDAADANRRSEAPDHDPCAEGPASKNKGANGNDRATKGPGKAGGRPNSRSEKSGAKVEKKRGAGKPQKPQDPKKAKESKATPKRRSDRSDDNANGKSGGSSAKRRSGGSTVIPPTLHEG